MLEENSERPEGNAAWVLGVKSYGVSMTTLEEVFLQLEETNEEEDKKEGEATAAPPGGATVNSALVVEVDEPVTVEEGNTKVAWINDSGKTAVDLNNSEVRKDSSKPPSVAKQQLLGLLKVCIF